MLMKDTVKNLSWDSLCENIVVDDEVMIDKNNVKFWVLNLVMIALKINSKSTLYSL